MENIKRSTIVQLSLLFGFSLIFGGILGWGLSETRNIENSEYITQFDTALPTKLLDINGELITELASDEKREIISLEKLPQLMIDALLTREDRIFYEHRGFSCKAVARAFLGKMLHLSLGGGSTLTQQIAGTLYCDRTDMTIWRKIKELWWAVQMERRCSKSEILETYLNRIYFGGGTYGVNAASKYYFGHSATEITPAEAAILVIQLSNPAYYNPFDHPNRAMERQHDVLNSMVKEGFISKADAGESFDTYWASFDYTRTSSSAYFMRDDKAPWFSEYVRRELGGMIYGAEDIYTSGFTVNTTLDLSQQVAASDVMSRYIAYANRIWKREQAAQSSSSFKTYVPLSELISLVFNLPGIKVSKERSQKIANETFVNRINPIIDVCSMMFGLENLKIGIVNKANTISKQEDEKTTIEGTMITLQNDTGYITALVGGSKYDQGNQLIRAVQSKLQPGSTFKPLYYSAAIDSRKFTPATEISDTPVVFHKADGTPYIPQNFKGEWQGNVQLWYALAHSMNVPSLKVLDGIGFDAAIERTAALLGIPNKELAERHFLPVYPFGLGVCSVRPVEMARAFAIFANSGKEVTPMAIRTIEDRNGNVVLNPELDIRKAQQAKGSAIQIISPQTAYVMTKMLENTTESGTLAGQGSKLTYRNDKGRSYTIPLAGKTGTTQNWADAWTVAYSPYYTSAFWFGFDKPGNSLGLHITGATLAGIAMGEYMGNIHKTLPYKDFTVPASGVVKVTICTDSGLLPTPECGNHIKTEWFLSGTEPTEVCNVHTNTGSAAIFYDRYEKEMYKSGQHLTNDVDTSPLKLDLNFLNNNSMKPAGNSNADDKTEKTEPAPDYNYLMD